MAGAFGGRAVPYAYRMSNRPLPPPERGVPARRAALRLLDAVLRRGEPLESALVRATGGLAGPDRGLAHALAAETLRRLPDLDALIDSVTKQRLPDDAKARFALRLALVQALVLGTPPHAAIATVLPLVDGGPRKLVHGVFGTLVRSLAKLPDLPTLPADTAARWSAAWGSAVVAAAARAFAAKPPLDLTLADPAHTAEWAERMGATSLAPGHLRLAGAQASVPDLPGFGDGAWWGAGHRRVAAGATGRCRRRSCSGPVRRAGGQDATARGGGLEGHGGRCVGKSSGAT